MSDENKMLSMKEIDEITEKEVKGYWDDVVDKLGWKSLPPKKLEQRYNGFKKGLFRWIKGKVVLFRHDLPKLKHYLKTIKEGKSRTLVANLKNADKQYKKRFGKRY